jgi:hypothetical protein
VPPPCTGVAFEKVEVWAGQLDAASAERLAFALPEGELKDGTWLRVAGAPRFAPGERYLVFVRAGEWSITPVTNWFHSVFRELPVGREGRQRLYVDPAGLVVTDLTEKGFVLGERIAPADDEFAGEDAPGAGRSGVRLSEAPPVSEKVRKLLEDPAADVAQLGLTRERLKEAITRLAERYPLRSATEIRYRPRGGGGASAVQRKPEASEAGLEPARVVPAQHAKEVFGKPVKDRESAPEPEKGPRAASAGREDQAPPRQ